MQGARGVNNYQAGSIDDFYRTVFDSLPRKNGKATMTAKWTTPVRAFYSWFHCNGRKTYQLESEREAFLAGWDAHEATPAKQNITDVRYFDGIPYYRLG